MALEHGRCGAPVVTGLMGCCSAAATATAGDGRHAGGTAGRLTRRATGDGRASQTERRLRHHDPADIAARSGGIGNNRENRIDLKSGALHDKISFHICDSILKLPFSTQEK